LRNSKHNRAYSVGVRAVLSVCVVALLAVAGCGGNADEAAPPTSTQPPAETPVRRAPDIAGVTLEGERLSLAGLRGQPVFVNVWSSW
jgi:hypothetical protein